MQAVVDTMPTRSLPEREGIGLFAFIALAGLMALFGSTSRLLVRWPEYKTRINAIGNFLVSITSGFITAALLWEQLYATHPGWLIAAIGCACWIGGDVIDRIGRHWFDKLGLGDKP